MKRHFSMLREFQLADWFTLANAFCGTGAVFAAMRFLQDGERGYLLFGMALIPLAFIFDALDGRIARWRKSSSTLGRELDSLSDVISFGVAPAALAYACGMQGGWDWLVLSYFVCCGVSRLAPGSWQRLFDWWGQLLPRAGAGRTGRCRASANRRATGTTQDVASQAATPAALKWPRPGARGGAGAGDGMLQWMLHGARGSTTAGAAVPEFVAWLQQFQLQVGPVAAEPGVRPRREHQARWQALLRAQEEYQQHSRAYVDQIKQALTRPRAVRAAQHEQPGTVTSARAMFDLWIDAAEEAYAKVAMSEPFQQVYARWATRSACAPAAARGGTDERAHRPADPQHVRTVPAGVRLAGQRADAPARRLQREVEQMSERIGLPTRSEMDAAHRRIAELERSLRRPGAGGGELAGTAEVDPVAQPAPAKVKPVARKAAKKAAPAKKVAAEKTFEEGRASHPHGRVTDEGTTGLQCR